MMFFGLEFFGYLLVLLMLLWFMHLIFTRYLRVLLMSIAFACKEYFGPEHEEIPTEDNNEDKGDQETPEEKEPGHEELKEVVTSREEPNPELERYRRPVCRLYCMTLVQKPPKSVTES